MWAFTGRLGLPDLGRGVSALAFSLSGYLVARLGTYPDDRDGGLAALAVVGGAGRADHRAAHARLGWLALVTALLLLAGHAQTAWYSLLLAGLFALFWLLRKGIWLRLPAAGDGPGPGGDDRRAATAADR